MRKLLFPAVLFLASCGGAWGWFPLLPDTRTPEDRARGLAQKCAGGTEEHALPALAPSLVESVEPEYATVDTGNDREVRLLGARLHLRPKLNVSTQALERTLECHQARVTLAQEQAADDDPYVLRGAWLDIDVDSSGDGLTAKVTSRRFDEARTVLARARTFAARR